MLLNCGVGEDFRESLGLQGDSTSPSRRRSTQNIHWKDWCWSWSSNTLAIWCKELTHWRDPDAGKDWRQEEKGVTEGEMVGWPHQLNGYELEQTLRDSKGQGGLACCSSWGCKESDTTESLYNNNVFQFSSVAQSCLTLCDAMDCTMPGFHVHHQLPELPKLSIRVFSNESVLCIKWPKYWSFSFNISPSNKHLGLISFRMDWLDLLAVQGTLKSLLQRHSSKASILQCSAFFIVQLSHPYMTTGKTIALTRWTFGGKTTMHLLTGKNINEIHEKFLKNLH